MTTLSSLIIARRAASIAQVDDALARQVVRGGDLGTCLLELGVMAEEALVPLLAEAHGFGEAAVGELPVASAQVLRLVPRAVALRYGIYPLEEREGELHVAVSEPLPQAVEDDLGFALGAHLRQLAAPMVRIRQAIARDYGLPLDRRFLRLLAKLEHKPDPSPSDPPPRDKTPPFPGTGVVRVSKFGTMIVDNAVPPPPPVYTEEPPSSPSPAHRIVAPAGRRNTWPGMLAAPPEHADEEPEFRTHKEPELRTHEEPEFRTSRTITNPFTSRGPSSLPEPAAPPPRMSTPPPPPPPPAPASEKRSAAPPPSFVMEATAATAAQVERKRRRRAENAPGKALLGWARRALGNTIPADRAQERRRGPLTAAEAELQLEGATTGEQALAAFFAFARQYFHYSALFVVHGDLAAGHDAWGAGATRDKVRGIGVALDLPSALSFAKGRAIPTLVQLKRVGLDADLRSDLARPAPHEVMVLPIMMRERCVALLYADDGEQAVDYGEIGDVVAMGSLLAATLERILIRKKRAALRDPSAVKSKLDQGFDRSKLSPSDPARASTSVPPELSDLAVKRGVWSEEELVDEGWTLPGDLDAPDLTPRSATPVEGKRSVPPPNQTGGGGPAAKNPADEHDSPPELLISEAEDASSMSELLDEIGEHPSPTPLNAFRSLSMPELVRRAVDPMASTSISAGPHPPPPPSQGPFRNLPSVLIRSDLVDQVVAGGEKAERALGEILALGEAAIPSVFARFPGPLTVDRNQALGELPRPADCGPVLRIVAAMRRLALPFLAVRSADADVEVRFWSTYLLGELNYADSGTALLPRLFDENPTVRRIALRSARSLLASGDEGNPIRKSLERMVISTDEPLNRRLTALATINELKLHRAIPALIEVLGDDSDALADGSARALAVMTRQEFGRDRRRWSDWWESKGKKRLG